MNDIDIFEKETEIEYEGNVYSVRDNGAIMRHAPIDRKSRPLDNKWTYGNIDVQKGYMIYGGVPVHRIVATAFLGPAPNDKKYVVDHIDTNKQNNRPENLRWLTRLENILFNDITRTKVEWIFGCSIEDILNDISILRSKKLTPQFEWMSHVSKEEAAKSLESWHNWCEEKKKKFENADYVRKLLKIRDKNSEGVHTCEPRGIEPSLDAYYENLRVNKTFYSRSYSGERSNYIITEFYYNKEANEIYVATIQKDGIKQYYLTTITITGKEYVYKTQSFFEEIGLKKYMTIAKGEEWTGGDCLDDYC